MSGLGWLVLVAVWLALGAVVCALLHLGRVRRDAEQINADLDETTALFGLQAREARERRDGDG